MQPILKIKRNKTLR